MPRGPVVTVLMSVHNEERYLSEAIRSIFAQTFGEFEFLIIDDGSTDGSREILAGLKDRRVRIIRNTQNLGLTPSLNVGLDAASGTFIARMDADDVAEPERLARQVQFFDSHPDVGLLGTGRTLINEDGGFVVTANATAGRENVLWKMLLGNAFAHPTVMLRRAVLETRRLRYDERFQTAQDYELWVRLLRHAAGDNLAEPLLRYRLRHGISRTRKPEQIANHDCIAFQAIRALLPNYKVTAEEVSELRGRYGGFSVRESSMDPDDPVWRSRHDAMLDAFARHYQQSRFNPPAAPA